jgi:hypothetical protein
MKKNDEMSLSDQCKEIILGSLLGDGSLKIHKPYKNARFSFRHSCAQEEYFCWKASALEEISSDKNIFPQKKDGFGTNDKLRYQSRALPMLTDLYELTHKAKQFNIRRKWLNMMSPLSLAIWWLDDGSLVSNSRKGVFCTDGFDKDSLKIIVRYLKIVWGITVHIGAVKEKRAGRQNEHYRLWIRSTEELKKFLRIILPHITIASMLYKVIILYKDTQLQQRWISEVARNTRFSKNVIERAMNEKRKKWKQFRE